MLQLVAGQNSVLNVKLIPGPPDSCQSREQLAAVDAAIQSIHQTRDEILSTLHLQCGSVVWTRAAYLNMSDPSQQCPTSWRLYSANGVRKLVDVQSPHQQLEDAAHRFMQSK